MNNYVVAFDTANEMISLGLGRLDRAEKRIECVASAEVGAFRASNVKLLPEIDDLLKRAGVERSEVACVVCGRGPGSFTGVRICLASAKGVAIGLGVPLFGVSTSDAQAWQQWDNGVRGTVIVLGDAMRKEVYPVRYRLTDQGIERLNSDTVMKAAALPEWLGTDAAQRIVGDALKKYADLCVGKGEVAGEEERYPTGAGLLLAAQAAWKEGAFDPDSQSLGDPCALLPVYTRLSDAEEHERIKFAKQDAAAHAVDAKDLESGVQGGSVIRYQPLEAAWAPAVAAMEAQVMGTDAWNEAQVLDELPRADRTWWAAFEVADTRKRTVNVGEAKLVGYAGGWVNDGQVQLLKVASSPEHRRQGIAQELLARIALDARDLGAREMTLEVRASNTGAHAFYERLGLKNIGTRPHYYSDKEDACIYEGPLPVAEHDVAGMELRLNAAAANAGKETGERIPLSGKLILAIESSCDETAAALIDEAGTIVSDVVASQIDFHSRFGGVVPEIASRKHIEAIGGVAIECLAQARERTGRADLSWNDLAAVSVTYAPGLVGALVVGLAFAKGLAWACDVPLIGVNHLEGHLYANKIACPDIKPPGGFACLGRPHHAGAREGLGRVRNHGIHARRCGGRSLRQGGKGHGAGLPGRPAYLCAGGEGQPEGGSLPPCPDAFGRSAILAFRLEDVGYDISAEGAAGRSRDQPGRCGSQLPGCGNRRAGG